MRSSSGTTRSRRNSANSSGCDAPHPPRAAAGVKGIIVQPLSRRDPSALVWVLAGMLVLSLLAGPLAALATASFSGPGGFTLANYRAAFAPAIHRGPILNSFLLAAAVGALSVVLGLPIAWGLARTAMPLRALVRALVVASFVTPSFLGAMAWIILAGPNAGLLNEAYRALTNSR